MFLPAQNKNRPTANTEMKRSFSMENELFVLNCSPTISGLKTGNMFSAEYESRAQVGEKLQRLNSLLSPKGMRILALRYTESRVLLYVYRECRLEQDLRNAKAKSILSSCGYTCDDPHACIDRLTERLRNSKEFPHEVGLFLGYPPEDVMGFIENGAKNFKLLGCWKVYGDAQAAKEKFASYEKCTELNRRKIQNGWTLGEIIQ